jgi:hypothetical protein
MDRTTAVDVVVAAYVLAVVMYAGWLLGRAVLRRDQEAARLRSELWELQAKAREAAEKAAPKEAAA